MLRSGFLLMSSLWVSVLSFGQNVNYNMDLVSHIDYETLHQSDLNDCWGYVDETGIEYALVGTTKGTSILSLQNPGNPVEVFWEPGTTNIWRDLQVYGDYAYVTTEATDGLLIIDLSPLPASTDLPTHYYFGPAGNPWQRAHDIFIDTLGGWAYICGANRGNGGLIILDIHTDPLNPVEVGTFDNWYCHDAYAQGNKLYGAHISDGFLSILDITDHSNPVLLNTQMTSSAFTHNVWVTSDDHYAVTTDEVANAFLSFYDVSDPMNISFTDKIQSSPGENVIPHNAFIKHDSIVVASYYSDGVTVHDMGRPHNVIQIGAYDTDPIQTSTYHGCWGVYPFLPSGLIVASDITNGLYILNPHLKKPGYYEGLVRDASDLSALSGVTVTVTGDAQPDITSFDGKFATGTITEGVQQVIFNKVAYYPDTLYIDFQAGVIETDTIDLVPIIPIHYTIHVQDFVTGDPIIDANVRVAVPALQLDGVTDGFGDAEMLIYYQGPNLVTVGKWGYFNRCFDTILNQDNSTIIVKLDKGYFDDFSFDFGWTAFSASATHGFWERGVPFVTGNIVTPQSDVAVDCNNYCYLTGNASTLSPNSDDVSGGSVTLKSPAFDLTGYTDPYLNYQRFFFNYYGPGAFDDHLKISIQNSTQIVVLDVTDDSIYVADWTPMSFRISDFINLENSMTLTINTSDPNLNNNITEAAFDYFMISEGSVAGIKESESSNWIIAPNPSFGLFKIYGLQPDSEVIVYDNSGKEMFRQRIESTTENIDLTHLASGLYTVYHNGRTQKIVLR